MLKQRNIRLFKNIFAIRICHFWIFLSISPINKKHKKSDLIPQIHRIHLTAFRKLRHLTTPTHRQQLDHHLLPHRQISTPLLRTDTLSQHPQVLTVRILLAKLTLPQQPKLMPSVRKDPNQHEHTRLSHKPHRNSKVVMNTNEGVDQVQQSICKRRTNKID